MEKSKDKNLEIEKLATELKRSLSVIEVKEAHKRIEDIEKSRKQSAIISIIQRIDSASSFVKGSMAGVTKAKKEYPELVNVQLPASVTRDQMISNITQRFDSIRFDFQKNLDIKEEDFGKLFHKPTLSFSTANELEESLLFICYQLEDMKAYCKRFI